MHSMFLLLTHYFTRALALISNTKITQVNSLKPTLTVVAKIFRRTTVTKSSNCNNSIKKTQSLCQLLDSSKAPVRVYSYSKTLFIAANKQSLQSSKFQYNLTTVNNFLSLNRQGQILKVPLFN